MDECAYTSSVACTLPISRHSPILRIIAIFEASHIPFVAIIDMDTSAGLLQRSKSLTSRVRRKAFRQHTTAEYEEVLPYRYESIGHWWPLASSHTLYKLANDI
jgi:hypothetical protein